MTDKLEKFIGTPCLCCGTTIEGKYCRECGQRATDVKQTMLGLLTEYLEHGLSLDSNFARTIISLLRYPGKLTVDYLAGRRAKYFSPVRLYFLLSLFFFWSLALNNTFDFDAEGKVDSGVVNISLPIREDGTSVSDSSGVESVEFSTADLDSTDTSFWNRVGMKLEEGGQKAAENPKAFSQLLISNISKAMFLFVPLFALLVRLLNFRRKTPYLPFMVFALHSHAVYFLFSTFFNIVTHFIPAFEDPFQGAMVFLFPVYIMVAMRRAFGGTWFRTWGKVAILVPAYGFCLILGLLLVAVVQMLVT